jgi:hypothetical protein
MTINARWPPAAVRERLLWLQQHLEQAVRRAFAQATGLPERSSDIEDIAEIGRILEWSRSCACTIRNHR